MLDLSYNEISGYIPEELGSLKNLVTLNLSANQFITIPWALSALSNLTHLNISYQYVYDTSEGYELPLSWANLTKLVMLDASYGGIRGSIPPEIGKLVSPRCLYLGGNKLSGPLPSTLGYLTNLIELYINRNQIFDFIPSEIGNLKRLTYLDLSAKNLSVSLDLGSVGLGRTIPPEISELSKLTSTSQIMISRSLVTLDLSSNSIHGTIPPALGLLTNLSLLNISHNYIEGELLLSFTNLSILVKLEISQNQIKGSITLEIGKLISIHGQNLGNMLSGLLPSTLGHLTSLTELCIDWNPINDSIPLEIGSVKKLTYLDLRGNYLSGDISPCLASSQLEINLSYNSLGG
ncbi:hypothetical protein FEM48_Zijuj01G0072000 [Ziziphus jujuba var. spinosa]|uniref:Uncharacterized protein n=1 Tax=Ziziphus jujuba var. spinosa TaxID=714518 RepID=A0A978VZV0_ZIZJJ|nr:hypothetical protein FEM48_Zijuj01G0072000 [Ziziphus jujuba var. spinosa]